MVPEEMIPVPFFSTSKKRVIVKAVRQGVLKNAFKRAVVRPALMMAETSARAGKLFLCFFHLQNFFRKTTSSIKWSFTTKEEVLCQASSKIEDLDWKCCECYHK